MIAYIHLILIIHYPMLKNPQLDEDLLDIISSAGEWSAACNHGFVNYDHLFVAILRKAGGISPYLARIDVGTWEEKIMGSYPPTYKDAGGRPLPLTVYANRILKHASVFAAKKVGAVHVLLSILSYENEVSLAFNRMGVIFEDVAEAYFNKPIKRVAPRLEPLLGGKERERLYQNAYNLFQYGQYTDCESVCKTTLGLFPGDIGVRALLAYSYIKRRDFGAALPLMKELVKDRPETTDFRRWLAFVYDELGDHAEAEAILDKVLKQRPYCPVSLNNRGCNLYHQGKYEDAALYFERALQLNPDFVYSWNYLGFVTYKLGQTAKAFSFIDKSLELDKGNALAYKHSGIIFMEQGYKEKAVKHFNLALRFGYTEKYGGEVAQLLQQL